MNLPFVSSLGKVCAAAFDSTDETPDTPGLLEDFPVLQELQRMLGLEGIAAAQAIKHASYQRALALDTLARRWPRKALAAIAAQKLAPLDLRLLEEAQRQEAPFVLALPLSTDALIVLARILQRPRQQTWVVEKTPLTQLLLEPILGGAGNVECVTPDVLIRRSRMREATGHRWVFVTFPDHHLTLDGTTRPVQFLGGPHHFSLVEPLLYARGASPILTLQRGEKCLQLASYARPVDRAAFRESDAQDLLQWLAEQLETVIRSAPTKVLSWRELVKQTSEALRLKRIMDGRLVQALIRTGGDHFGVSEARQQALARLRQIEEAQKEEVAR